MSAAKKRKRQPSKLTGGRLFLILFVLAFAIRLVYLISIQDIPTFDEPVMDEAYHIQTARQISSPEGLSDEPYYRAPLYLYFLSITNLITGGSFFGIRFIQILLGSFLPILLLLLGRHFFEEKVARIGAFVSAVYPTFIYFDNSLLITPVMVLLSTALVWQLARTESEHRLREYFIAGLLLGLAGIARPNILIFGPVLIIWAWLVLAPRVGGIGTIKRYALIGAGAVLIVLPVTVRNVVVADDFVFIAWQGGYNFYLGNNRDSEGWSATAEGIDKSWEGGYEEAIRIAEQERGKQPLEKSEVSEYWYERGWEEITADPGHFFRLLLRKLLLMFNGYEIPNNQNIYLTRDYAPIIKPLMFTGTVYFPYGIVAPLSIMGLALSLRRWRKYLLLYVFLASYIGTLLFFFVTARFRQPFIPILILFAVYAVFEMWRFFRRRDYRTLAILSVVLVALAIESNHNMLGPVPDRISSYDHFMLGTVYEAEGRLQMARAEYEKSLEEWPNQPMPLINLGILSANQGQVEQAARYFARAIEIDPTLHQAYLNLSVMLGRMGRHEEAARVLEGGREQKPLDPDIHHQLALAYYRLGRYDESLESVEEALRLNPNNAAARRLQGRVRQILSTGQHRN